MESIHSSGPSTRSDLPPMDTGGRLARLQDMLGRESLAALVITNLTNVRYLTGFTGSSGVVVATPSSAVLVTDGRYRIQAGREVREWGCGVEVAIAATVPEQGETVAKWARVPGRIGFEGGGGPWELVERLRAAVGAEDGASGALGRAELAPGLVEELRTRKDRGEVARIEAAAAVADRALGIVLAQLGGRSSATGAPSPGADRVPPVTGARSTAASAGQARWDEQSDEVARSVVGALLGGPQVTEAAVALALDTAMRCLGASASAFETIVASGPRGAQPHARPTGEPVEAGELIVIDFGAVVDGYRSDMTRTVCLGPPSRPLAPRMAEVVAEAQAAGVAAVSEESDGASVDRACRDVIAAAGWAEAFSHGTGHGVGLDIHEAPWVGKSSTGKLPYRSVITVEPGVYLEGVGGVRIEDTVVVDGPGCRVLTNAPKELVI